MALRFNSRAHGGRDQLGVLLRRLQLVSIHAPTGGATVRGHRGRLDDGVSIHAPTGGATRRTAAHQITEMFQFTRPRGARPSPRYRAQMHGVSIHAPTGGATSSAGDTTFRKQVSIHAPTGGATQEQRRRHRVACFNSRAHGGRDRRWRNESVGVNVSIHAPTGGATSARVLRREERGFQFTRPRGARLSRVAYRGCLWAVSIHAPTGGATSIDNALSMAICFNSRAHGGRDTRNPSTDTRYSFQFTRPRGARLNSTMATSTGWWFQFTRPRGARPGRFPRASRAQGFQFTRPRGARRAMQLL